VQGSWAIFDGKLTDGRVAQAKSQLEQTRLARAEQTLAVEVEVRRALSSLQEATELVDAAKQVVRQAEEALRLATVRNSAGTATQLDVLSTQVALTQARNNRLSADYRQAVALATLRTALGEADAYTPAK
jgi:outer membrane protein TolC